MAVLAEKKPFRSHTAQGEPPEVPLEGDTSGTAGRGMEDGRFSDFVISVASLVEYDR